MGKRGTSAFLASMLLLTALGAQGADDKFDVNQIGKRKVARRNLISYEKEVKVGKRAAQKIDDSGDLLTDPIINEYVERVARKIASNSDLKKPLTIKVVNQAEFNASVLPGGFLYVFTGLLAQLDDEGELAGVLAHEIAHLAARHWANQATKRAIARSIELPLMSLPISGAIYTTAAEVYLKGMPFALLKFSRGQELEADFLGLQYMYKAGYDPNCYIRFLQRAQQLEGQGAANTWTLFKDHPHAQERIARALEEIRAILPDRQYAAVSKCEFDSIKERLLGDSGSPDTPDLSAAETQPPDGTHTIEETPPAFRRRD